MRTRCTALAALFFLVFSCVWPMRDLWAQHQSFERLPDGRIFIEIFGQQIALPDSEADRIYFYAYQASEKRYGKPMFSLQEALADPNKAQKVFEEEERWVNVRIITSRSGPLILERFESGTVPESPAADPIHIVIRRAPLQSFARGRLPDRWPPEAQLPDADGYFVRPGITGPNQTRPADTGYRLPAQMRLFPAAADLVVICTHVGAPTRLCKQGLRSEDGRISIGWSWYEPGPQITPEMRRLTFPKSAWKSLDLKLRELTDYLLLNRPAGGME